MELGGHSLDGCLCASGILNYIMMRSARANMWVLVFSLALMLAGCSSRSIVFDQHVRESTFEVYLKALGECYPDAEACGLHAQEFEDRWRAEVVDSETVTEYYHALARMCSEVGDPHLVFKPNFELWEQLDGPLGASDLAVINLNGRAGLWFLSAEAVDDMPLQRQIRDFNGWTVHSLHGAKLQRSMLTHPLNIGPQGSTFVIELQSPDGTKTAELIRRRGLSLHVQHRHGARVNLGTQLYAKARHANRSFLESVSTSDSAVHHGTYISVWNIDGVGVLVWEPGKHFPGDDEQLRLLRADLDAAGEVLRGVECAVIDLRYQSGGSYPGFAAVMESLMSESLTFKSARARSELFGLLSVTHASDVTESPSIIGSAKHTVILVNERTASYGEWMASLLRRNHAGTTIGARTSGSEYCVVDVAGPDGSLLRFGGDPFERFDDVPVFQTVGLTPDRLVAVNLSDFPSRSIEDVLMQAHARQWEEAWSVVGSCPP